jgi:hypothetical protein
LGEIREALPCCCAWRTQPRLNIRRKSENKRLVLLTHGKKKTNMLCLLACVLAGYLACSGNTSYPLPQCRFATSCSLVPLFTNSSSVFSASAPLVFSTLIGQRLRYSFVRVHPSIRPLRKGEEIITNRKASFSSLRLTLQAPLLHHVQYQCIYKRFDLTFHF